MHHLLLSDNENWEILPCFFDEFIGIGSYGLAKVICYAQWSPRRLIQEWKTWANFIQKMVMDNFNYDIFRTMFLHIDSVLANLTCS